MGRGGGRGGLLVGWFVFSFQICSFLSWIEELCSNLLRRMPCHQIFSFSGTWHEVWAFPCIFYECMSSQSLCHFLYYKSIIVVHNEDHIGGNVILLCLYSSCTSEFHIFKKINSHKTSCELYETDQHLWKKKVFLI